MCKEMQSVITDENLSVNSFKRYLDNDKYVSSSIVGLLQFISKTLPKDFHVTSLELNSTGEDHLDTSIELSYSSINVNIIGFYEKNLETSIKRVEKLRKGLEDTGKFKNIFIGKGKKVKQSQSQFSINLVY